MVDPSPGWDPVPVYGRFRIYVDGDGDTDDLPCTGVVEFRLEGRVVRADGGTIWPLGLVRTATLDSQGRVSIPMPAVDDPAVRGVKAIKVTEKIVGRTDVTYFIEPRLSDLDKTPPGFNLGDVLVEDAQTGTPALVRGRPGGVAGLDADGDVIDADGNKVGASALGAIIAGPRTPWAAGTAYATWSHVTYGTGLYTAVQPIAASSSPPGVAAGWWLTGYDPDA